VNKNIGDIWKLMQMKRHETKGAICGMRLEPTELNSADVGEDIIRSYLLPF
jgi:hypothetical protein